MIYKEETISLRLKTRPVDYGQDCRPTDPDIYQKIDTEFKERAVFDLWEAVLPNARGWLGVVDDEGKQPIEGAYKTYLHTGSYVKLMEAGKEIGRTQPKMTEFYMVYLNSPQDTAEGDLKTKIVFR